MKFRKTLIAFVALMLSPTMLHAHHPTGGEIPSTLGAGLLSGLGHPVIGLDHLAFIIAVGVVCAAFKGRKAYIAPLGFVVATAIGTFIHLQEWNLTITETAVGASSVLAGLALLFRSSLIPAAYIGFPILGIFHGYAYGESIVGAETAPLAAYLGGFVVVQYVIALIAMMLTKKFAMAAEGEEISPLPTKVFSGAFIVVGLLALTGNLPEIL